MDIGIIDAGSVWGTLARKLVSAGHRVRIANSKDPSKLAEFEEEDGITAMWAGGDAVDGAEVAILSVPQKGSTTRSRACRQALHLLVNQQPSRAPRALTGRSLPAGGARGILSELSSKTVVTASPRV
jgi:predicted dinucleotide-binding enzyme